MWVISNETDIVIRIHDHKPSGFVDIKFSINMFEASWLVR